MLENRIQYGYKYEEDFEVYLIRRLDGEVLDYTIPSKLFNVITKDYELINKNKVQIGYEQKYIHYDSECKYAIVDFKKLNYTQEEIDKTVKDINKQYNMPKKEKSKILKKNFIK